jgi:hypothetical protein
MRIIKMIEAVPTLSLDEQTDIDSLLTSLEDLVDQLNILPEHKDNIINGIGALENDIYDTELVDLEQDSTPIAEIKFVL